MAKIIDMKTILPRGCTELNGVETGFHIIVSQ